jgi:NitT/TauT family transport system substrate-binding protein
MAVLRNMVGTALLAVAVSASAFVAAEAQELKKINFLSTNDHSCGIYPQSVSRAFGYFADEGVEVNLLSTSTTVPYVAFLQNGDADVVTLDSAQVIQAVDNGLPIKVIYEAFQNTPDGIVVKDDSKVTKLEELTDATIGMASDRDQITTAIIFGMIGKTLDEAKIKTVVVGDAGPVMAKALQDGTVDAFVSGASDRAAMEAAGLKIRNITPVQVNRAPGNSFAVWGPTLGEKRDVIARFLAGWAKGQLAGVMDTKLAASACRTFVPEQFENLESGMRLINYNVYTSQLRRTKNFGEPQPDIWAELQKPYLQLGEIKQEHDPATFLDSSFIEAANDWETDEVKKGMYAWKEANQDKLIP